MEIPDRAKAGGHGRSIFSTGEYIEHFTPEDSQNPFYRMYDQKKRDAARIIESLNAPGGIRRILDVGGGMGRLSQMLAGSAGNWIVLADISPQMIAFARQRALGDAALQFVHANAQALPFAQESFDVIVGLDLFCHLEYPEATLSEFHRVLTESGTLLLDSTNNNPLWTIFFPRYLGRNPLRWIRILRLGGVLPGWETIVTHYSRKKFMSFLKTAGFSVVKNLGYGPAICPKWHLTVSQKALRVNPD